MLLTLCILFIGVFVSHDVYTAKIEILKRLDEIEELLKKK